MKTDIEQGYMPSCSDCQRNKSLTQKPAGPLHPLLVPDQHGDSVAIDFIGLLPEDNGFNCIVTMTDTSGANIRIVATRTDLSAEQFAQIFFDQWYCNNGLLLHIISDRDKLFVSRFWHALHSLTGIHLKMSSTFHPQTDSASEHTNKTVNQCLRFHIDHAQTRWAQALPLVHFNIMNTVNSSTGYSNFQVLMGQSPCVLPPLTPTSIDYTDAQFPIAGKCTATLLQCINAIANDARDHLLASKIDQAEFANQHQHPDPIYTISDNVLLSTLHRCRDYQSLDSSRVAKFMPRYNGPYHIMAAHPATSSYTLDLPHSPNICPSFHSSKLHPFLPNDDTLYPSHTLAHPPPVMNNGIKD